MKSRIVVLLFCLAVTIGLAQAQQIILNGTRMQTTLIDVRTPEEFAAGHIPDAINIPFDRIGTDIQQVKGLRKDSKILLYCRSGRRSAIAKQTLEKDGFRDVQDGGGMQTLVQTLKVCNTQQPC